MALVAGRLPSRQHQTRAYDTAIRASRSRDKWLTKTRRLYFLASLSDACECLQIGLDSGATFALQRRLLESDLRMFRSLPETVVAKPELTIRKGLTLASLGKLTTAHEIFRSSTMPTPEARRLGEELRKSLEE